MALDYHVTENLTHRFNEKYQILSESGCWIWTGSVSGKGYGRFKINGKWHAAHRVSFEIHNLARAGSKFVCHTCDVRCCVNPDHLWLGTHAENMRDMAKKGRWHGDFGRRVNGRTILSESDVLAIRKDNRTHREICADYGVSRATISALKVGLTWGYLQDE